ncbi:MAG TPA: methionine adenosyltransferase domain-containing protein, partial [bacterium]|nr:methionine adenosyltransferase domain-containing protein [bacterium]
GRLPESKIVELIKKNFDLSPTGIINHLGLLQPIYRRTACYGHFGRENEAGFPWEKRDAVTIFRNGAGL